MCGANVVRRGAKPAQIEKCNVFYLTGDTSNMLMKAQ